MRYFVTGTGTGVGKTFVTAMLARRARTLARSVFAFKPIETGCLGPGEDQETLAVAAGDWQQGELRGLYRFPLAAAPLVAAEAVGGTIDLEKVIATIESGAAGRDLVLVEGAGGWRVPITKEVDMGSLAHRLGWPVIIVGLATLGTINHSLLTIEAVERSGSIVAAVILSVRPTDAPQMVAENVHQIARRVSCRVALSTEDLDDLVVSGLSQ